MALGEQSTIRLVFRSSVWKLGLQVPVIWVAQLQMEMLASPDGAQSALLVSRSATKVSVTRASRSGHSVQLLARSAEHHAVLSNCPSLLPWSICKVWPAMAHGVPVGVLILLTASSCLVSL